MCNAIARNFSANLVVYFNIIGFRLNANVVEGVGSVVLGDEEQQPGVGGRGGGVHPPDLRHRLQARRAQADEKARHEDYNEGSRRYEEVYHLWRNDLWGGR